MGGKPTWGRSCPKRVSVTNTPNELMRRCLLRWQTETSGGAFNHFWQHFLGVSFKDRFRRHLTTYCEVRRNSLTPKISRLLPGSDLWRIEGMQPPALRTLEGGRRHDRSQVPYQHWGGLDLVMSWDGLTEYLLSHDLAPSHKGTPLSELMVMFCDLDDFCTRFAPLLHRHRLQAHLAL